MADPKKGRRNKRALRQVRLSKSSVVVFPYRHRKKKRQRPSNGNYLERHKCERATITKRLYA
jgi:hypothetical protein